jgi:hypothetical protein
MSQALSPTLPAMMPPSQRLLVQTTPMLLGPSANTPGAAPVVAYRSSVLLDAPTTGGEATLSPQVVNQVGRLATQLLLASQWPKDSQGIPKTEQGTWQHNA